MEISLQKTAAAPITTTPFKNGAATPSPTVEAALRDSTQATAIPSGLGLIGAVNEARITTLKDGKTPPEGFERTLKPYDTVILPYVAADEKQLHHSA